MRIDSSDLVESSALQSGKAADAQAIDSAAESKTSEEVTTVASDAVDLSQFVSRLSSMLNTNSPERAGLVEALSASYDSGSYQIDSAAVSRAILRDCQGSGQLSSPDNGMWSA